MRLIPLLLLALGVFAATAFAEETAPDFTEDEQTGDFAAETADFGADGEGSEGGLNDEALEQTGETIPEVNEAEEGAAEEPEVQTGEEPAEAASTVEEVPADTVSDDVTVDADVNIVPSDADGVDAEADGEAMDVLKGEEPGVDKPVNAEDAELLSTGDDFAASEPTAAGEAVGAGAPKTGDCAASGWKHYDLYEGKIVVVKNCGCKVKWVINKIPRKKVFASPKALFIAPKFQYKKQINYIHKPHYPKRHFWPKHKIGKFPFWHKKPARFPNFLVKPHPYRPRPYHGKFFPKGHGYYPIAKKYFPHGPGFHLNPFHGKNHFFPGAHGLPHYGPHGPHFGGLHGGLPHLGLPHSKPGFHLGHGPFGHGKCRKTFGKSPRGYGWPGFPKGKFGLGHWGPKPNHYGPKPHYGFNKLGYGFHGPRPFGFGPGKPYGFHPRGRQCPRGRRY